MSKQAENCHIHHALKNRPRKNNSVFLEKSIFGIYYSPGKKSKLLVEFYFQLFFEFTVHSLEKPKYFLISLLLFTQSTCQDRSTGLKPVNGEGRVEFRLVLRVRGCKVDVIGVGGVY